MSKRISFSPLDNQWFEITEQYQLHPEGQEMLVKPGQVPDELWDLYQEGLRNLREAASLLEESLRPIAPASLSEAAEIQAAWERDQAEQARLLAEFEDFKSKCTHQDGYGSMVMDGRCMLCATKIPS